jgi:tetratricopeptide (TPR) repeat protein
VKRILDRLMARQRKLLATLDPPRPAKLHPPMTELQRADRLAAENTAVEAAFVHLAAGRLDEAQQLLLPLAAGAQDARVLTTLGRIRSVQGDFDAAEAHFLEAERLAPADPKVLHFMADLLKLRGRHKEEVLYRRRAAFTRSDAPAESFARLITALVKAMPDRGKVPLSEVRLALERVKAAADLTPETRIEAARALFGIKPLIDDALALYAQADPPATTEREVVAYWKTLSQWCRQNGRPMHNLLEQGRPGLRPTLAELNDAIVFPGFQWMPLLDDGRVALSRFAASRIRLRSEDPRSPLLMVNGTRALARLPVDLPRIEGPVLLLGGGNGYYHDLVEYMGALAVPETLGMGEGLRLLVNADLAPHQVEWLELLGIPEERLLRWDPAQPVRVGSLWLPSRLAAGGRWFDPLLPRWYRQRFAPAMSSRAPTRKLYLSRRGAGRRRVDNEAEVLAALGPLGFECVHPETLSLREQVRLFSEASHIVGPTGAAFTNMLFAPPGAQVVVLQNRHLVDGGGDRYFDALAHACGHLGGVLPCSPSRLLPGERAIDADVHVDVLALTTFISEDAAHAPDPSPTD